MKNTRTTFSAEHARGPLGDLARRHLALDKLPVNTKSLPGNNLGVPGERAGRDRAGLRVRFGRIVVSEIEAPYMFVIMV